MLLRNLLTALIFIGLISCSDGPEVNQTDLIVRDNVTYLKISTEPFTGVGIEYYPNGRKKWEKEYDNGYLLILKTWYSTGEKEDYIKLTGDNTSTGIAESWYENGQLMQVYSIKNGQIVPGSKTVWDERGNEIK